jgi:hypothetical protein
MSPFTPVGFITPCGPNSAPYKELLIILHDGSLLSSFSDNVSGYNTRLAFLPDGTYYDTDPSACVFTISTSGSTRSISWNGGGQSWSINPSSTCGTNGTNEATLVNVRAVTAAEQALGHCPNVGGQAIESGLDTNGDGILESSEITSTAYVCNGAAGANGANGHSAIINIADATTQQCPNGGSVILTATDANDNGIIDPGDSNIQSATICNGTNGQNGCMSPFTPVGFITPCGPNSSPWKELLIILHDGSLLASFSDNVSGYNTRLAFITDGTYQDTDPSACVFTISTSGLTRSISWSGGGQSWSINLDSTCTQ